jgi:transglutaminase-like putative cysteine protease
MLRPRESHELRLVSSEIKTWPASTLSWAQDVFGNSIATTSFAVDSDTLVIESTVTLELTSKPWPVFPIDARAVNYPFSYSADEQADLGALISLQYPDSSGQLSSWAAGFVRGNPTDTLALLKDLNAGVSATISYQVREDEGTQSPTRTLNLGFGSCRDFAVLFVEAARALGFGARIVSGYVFTRTHQWRAGTTHAWAEVFIPGAGWISFDPTNRQTGSYDLIPVAVARALSQAMPVSGTFIGTGSDQLAHIVSVRVTEQPARNALSQL